MSKQLPATSVGKAKSQRSKKTGQFKVGNVRGYLRGSVWYLCYHESGQRRRPRVGPDKNVARQMAAQINGQIEVGAPAALSFEAISLNGLRDRWLTRHEHVLRSSVQTIRRYRTATDHLIRFVKDVRPVKAVSHFYMSHAEDFVRHLRSIRVASNGHSNAAKRPLMDKGIQFILETCRTLFAFAMKRRHLPPYAENPFTALELGKLPIEHVRKIVLPTPEQQFAFLKACDDWQFPVFLTLMLTGVRPGELVHLLLPEDLDFEKHLLHVRNRVKLGWQVKTRNERTIPLIPCLSEVLKITVGERRRGPVFLRRQFRELRLPSWSSVTAAEAELARRVQELEANEGVTCSRVSQAKMALRLWAELGTVKTDQIRTEFMRLTKDFGQPDMTAPKVLRHLFATTLQDFNVDPLIRNQLMGHSTANSNHSELGMTGTYTHTRPETKRSQLEATFAVNPIVTIAADWVDRFQKNQLPIQYLD